MRIRKYLLAIGTLLCIGAGWHLLAASLPAAPPTFDLPQIERSAIVDYSSASPIISAAVFPDDIASDKPVLRITIWPSGKASAVYGRGEIRQGVHSTHFTVTELEAIVQSFADSGLFDLATANPVPISDPSTLPAEGVTTKFQITLSEYRVDGTVDRHLSRSLTLHSPLPQVLDSKLKSHQITSRNATNLVWSLADEIFQRSSN